MNNDRFTLRCAVYVMFVKNNKILLYRRVNTGWQDGKFGIPGGHLEDGETVSQAAVREAKEETELIVKESDLQLVEVGHRQFVAGKSKESTNDYIDIIFKAKKWKGNPIITKENKSDEILWVDPKKLPKNTIKSVSLMIENYLNKINYFYFNN